MLDAEHFQKLERTVYEFASLVMHTTYWSGIGTEQTLHKFVMDVSCIHIIDS